MDKEYLFRLKKFVANPKKASEELGVDRAWVNMVVSDFIGSVLGEDEGCQVNYRRENKEALIVF